MLDLGSTFIQSVERNPHAPALVAEGKRLTYAQWFDIIKAVAGGLEQRGLLHGDHVLVVMQNRWEMATVHWACQLLGVIVTPLNWRAKPDEIEYCLTDSEAKIIIYDDSCLDAVREVGKVADIGAVAVGEGLPGSHRFEDLLIATPIDGFSRATAEDVSLMLYTSGTTGKPKGVPRRHRHERAAALAHVAQNLYACGERTLGVMPLYHTMGVRSLLSMALIDGCFVCMPRFDVEQALTLIESEGVTNLYLVPTLYHDMLSHPRFPETDVSRVRKLGFAGAPMSEALLRRLDNAFSPDLFVNHYGSSEVYTMAITQNARAKAGCCGRAAINCRLRVVKLGSSNPADRVENMQEGQIIAHLDGDEAFEGYRNRPDANEKSLIDRWYFTGDIGYYDADGELFVSGRVDDMIISGGENISPVDIESVISLHPAVDEVAVAGVEDERWGHRVVAFVKRKASVNAEELDQYCRSTDLANFKRPREYVFVAALPKSPVGKILRRKLVAGEYDPDTSCEPTPDLAN
ncbi:AMP-binding protein [Advenella mimigardefordensis]|uniref:AMP-dependent ligase n=1 Tax=Advenella mimigardefordensis (strain DSM 17166 / LMG 22922 / DPN7) TaxID=1247726 RepID=W0PFP5_ADVMD|nr:AMP-binding protein [Advenella mimigardefordensis]AHG65501.1 AMP-dependent ligase [Advenella mimigardefordensis DPN7]